MSEFSDFLREHVVVIPVTMPAPRVCDWQGCSEYPERDFLYCREHLTAEIERHVSESDA